MKSIFIIFALLVSGCASSTVPHAFLPEGFNDDEIAIMRIAAQKWITATDGKCSAIITESCDNDTCSVIRNTGADQDNKAPGSASEAGSCMGYQSHEGITTHDDCTNLPNADRYVIKTPSSPNLGHIVLHELGHTFQAHHIGRGNVMDTYLYPDDPDELTADDIADAHCE